MKTVPSIHVVALPVDCGAAVASLCRQDVRAILYKGWRNMGDSKRNFRLTPNALAEMGCRRWT
jgi:hypothetical protein